MRRGFTLLETIIAFALGAMLLFLAAGVFQAAVRGRDTIRHTDRGIAELRRAFEFISRDMHSMVLPPSDSGTQFGLTAAAGAQTAPTFQFATVVAEPLLVGTGTNETALVQYLVQPDPQSGRSTLYRYETSYQPQNGGTTAAQSASQPRIIPLLPGVTSVTYSFYQDDTTGWTDTWSDTTTLPTAIRMDVTREASGPGKQGRLESWMFQLPGAAYANDVAADASGTGQQSSNSSSGQSTTGGAPAAGRTGPTAGPTGAGQNR